MFLAEVLTAIVEGLKQTFNEDYPVADFRGLAVGIEYPAEAQNYPGIWVDFQIEDKLAIVGVSHREYANVLVDDVERFGEVTRWRFQGTVQLTIVTLSALSRARLMDEVVRIIGFGDLERDRGGFRTWIENNSLIAMNVNYDELGVTGMSVSAGTPWGSDELVYEVTLTTDALGEFVSTPTGTLVALTDITIESTPDAPAPDWLGGPLEG